MFDCLAWQNQVKQQFVKPISFFLYRKSGRRLLKKILKLHRLKYANVLVINT